MIDLTLRAPDRATLRAALLSAGLWDSVTDQPFTASHTHSLDVAGTMYAPDGTTTTDKATGLVTVNQQAIKGYYAFLRVPENSPLPKQLAALIVDKPATTLRTWSGGSYLDGRRYDPVQDKVVTLDAATAKSKVAALQFADSKPVAVDKVDAIAEVIEAPAELAVK